MSRSSRNSTPLSERVYETLRDAIVDGEMVADRQLVQEQIADELGVSRTPVRDALNRLAYERLVTWSPVNGFVVNGLTEHDITEVYQVRFMLERLAASLACGNHTPAQLARLRWLIEKMASERNADGLRHFDLNRQFHLALIEPCGNQLLVRLLETVWDHPANRRITKAYVHDMSNVDEMIHEHRELLAAAETNDAPRLVALVANHLTSGYRETLIDPLTRPDIDFGTPPTLQER